MSRRTATVLSVAIALSLAACDSEEAQITTTTIDATQLTTTSTTDTTASPGTADTAPDTTQEPADQVESYEVISRVSEEEGETLYILVAPGDYSDVSMENFLVTLLEDEPAVSGAEVFDDRAALDAALKDEEERTEDETELIGQHHLVSLVDGRQVDFQGPLEDFEDFIIGS
ncbi:MAG: hypothetical protein ACLFWM_13750 [Actinomycetota bacterium]